MTAKGSPKVSPALRFFALAASAVALALFSYTVFRSVIQTGRVTSESQESIRRHQAHMQLSSMLGKVNQFVLDQRRLPKTLEELDVAPASANKILDPWGTPLLYEILEPQPKWFRIGSAGPDRTAGTDDDIVREVAGTKPR